MGDLVRSMPWKRNGLKIYYNSGNVGIGTNDPSSALHVIGAALISSGSTLGAINFGADVNTTTRSTNVRKLAVIGAPDYTNTKTVEIFSFDSTAADTNLVVFGGRSNGSQYCATDISFVTTNDTSVAGGTTRLRINSTGHIGIGLTPASTNRFQVRDASGNPQARFDFDGSNGFTITASSVGLITMDANGTGAAFTFNDPLNVVSTTGGILTLNRNDTSATAADVIGRLQFTNNDTQLTTQQVYANIEVQALQTVITDAAAGKMIVRVTGTAAGGSPIEQFNLIDGTMTLKEALNVAVGTTTGTKIGTATTQKIGFWNATPVVQQATSAYTPDTESSAYTGIDNAQAGTPYAQLTDLNALRVAYETLRTSYDDLLTKLKNTGVVA